MLMYSAEISDSLSGRIAMIHTDKEYRMYLTIRMLDLVD